MEILTFVIFIVILAVGGFTFYFSFKPKKQLRTDSLYTDALNAMIRGDKRDAARLLSAVVKQDSNHVNAYLQLGNILRDSNPQQAIKIHQSLTVRPGISNDLKIDIHQSLALDYKEMSQLERAKREADHILKIERRNLWATEFLLQIAEDERDWVRAAQLAKVIQRIRNTQDSEQLAKFQVYEGMDKLANGDRNNARNAFRKAIKIAPGLGLPYLRLGNLFAEERNLVKAVENWEQFALLSPDESSKVFSKVESALFDMGRFSEVEKFYRRMIEKNPGNLDALVKMANVLEEKGEHKAALQLMEEALSRNNDSLHARLMKLKLSLQQVTPHELAHQIDAIIDLLTENDTVK